MKVEFAQLAGRDNGTAYNLERALAAIAACAADTQLIVFPETHLMGFPSAETVADIAEPVDGPTVQAIIQAAQARDIAVVIGMAESDGGQFYNTTLLITPEGIALRYRKTHLWASDRGVFTDTANFVSIIPECTNISCGYANEHVNMECQDLHHLERLGEAVLLVDWEALPTKRDPDADLCWGRGVRRSTRADDGLFMTGWPPESKLGDGFADEEYGFWAALQSARAGTLDDLGFLIKEWVGHEVIDMDAIAYHHLDTIDDTGMSAWEALDYLAVVATGAVHE